ncbi:Alpha/Beta hydrolase protein [Myxozyma melibiosi]|uniref:Alpha/Beta hydrolase protein n=1 Tax=Myxozyma melibiosi TaxID=54550 RepID=A0ABR1F2A0_9ASCO
MTAQVSETTFVHPQLGRVKGIHAADGVDKFLGIKYATISARFEDPQLFEAVDPDATKYGPPAPQPPGGCAAELGYIGQKMELPPIESQPSEFECLNLNITKPSKDYGFPLPVFVWTHGGGVVVGANCWPQFDMVRLVEQSIAMGKPVIGVGLNYRLGPLSSLTSTSMAEYGLDGNNSYKDVVAAYEWTHKYISGFGGDPKNITAIAESAGAIINSMVLQLEKPMFRRAVLFSGAQPVNPPVPLTEHDKVFKNVLKTLEISEDLPIDKTLEALRAIPSEEFTLKLLPVTPFSFAQTKSVKHWPMTYFANPELDFLPGRKWCEHLVLSDCEHDGTIMTRWLVSRKEGINAAFRAHVLKSFSDAPELASLVLSEYGLAEDIDDATAYGLIEELINDVCFYSINVLFARGYRDPSRVHLIHINVTDKWPGAYVSNGTPHTFDLALLFQNLREKMDDETARISKAFAADILEFVNGGVKYPVFKGPGHGSENSTVYSERGADGSKLVATEVEARRRVKVFDLVEKVEWDALSKCLQSFVFGG